MCTVLAYGHAELSIQRQMYHVNEFYSVSLLYVAAGSAAAGSQFFSFILARSFFFGISELSNVASTKVESEK